MGMMYDGKPKRSYPPFWSVMVVIVLAAFLALVLVDAAVRGW